MKHLFKLSIISLILISCTNTTKTLNTDVQIEEDRMSYDIDKIELSQNTVNLSLGKTLKLESTVTLKNNDKNSFVVWTSSDPETVSVNSSGEIKALKKGKAVIKVTSDKNYYKFAECVVTVDSSEDDLPAFVSIENDKNSELAENDKIQLSAFVIHKNGKPDQEITWKVSDDNIAFINDTGLLIPKRTGNITVTATSKKDNSIFSDINIKVVPQIEKSIINSDTSKNIPLIKSSLPPLLNNQSFKYDGIRDFDINKNPNGVWSYGRYSREFFQPFKDIYFRTDEKGIKVYTINSIFKLPEGQVIAGDNALLMYNTNNKDYNFITGEYLLPYKHFCLRAGHKEIPDKDDLSGLIVDESELKNSNGYTLKNEIAGEEEATVRWTAPEDGQYQVICKFTGIVTGTPSSAVKMAIHHNKTTLWNESSDSFKVGNKKEFYTTISLLKNDTLDFCAVSTKPGNNLVHIDQLGINKL